MIARKSGNLPHHWTSVMLVQHRKQPSNDEGSSLGYAHGCYAFGYVPVAGSRGGSHFWFAPSYANLVRTTRPACYEKLWLPTTGFHYGFQGFVVVSTESRLIKRTKSTIRTCHTVIEDQSISLRISFTSDLVLVTVASCMLPIGSKE